jgi:hypothetical protein
MIPAPDVEIPIPLHRRKADAAATTAPVAAPAHPPETSQAPSSTPTPGPIASAPAAKPAYGRWTVAPDPGGATGATALGGCTPETLAQLTGAAHEACAKRLSELARNAPRFPLIGDKAKAKDLQDMANYRDQLRAWRDNPDPTDMSPHPCPPQKEPTHKLYLDHCALMNGAVRFKYRF